MPALFGRQPGPRQRPDSDTGYPARPASTLATWVARRALKPEQLAALLPKDFTLTDPLLIVEAITLDQLPWLGGRGYEMLVVSVPVVHTASNGIETAGRLALVIWENCPDAIISGREELGWNKVFADSMNRAVDDNTTRYTVGWGGTEFFRLDFTPKKSIPSIPEWRSGTLMHYRVLPRTGEWGKLEIEQVTGSDASPDLIDARGLRRGAGSFAFEAATFEQLPTLLHIVNALAAVDLGETVDAGQARVASWADLADTRILDEYPPKA